MATISGSLPLIAVKTAPSLPRPLQAPLFGLGWFAANLLAGWLGFAFGHSFLGAMLAGALDGSLISVIVVARASEKFQSGLTGLLSGVSLDKISSGGGQTLVARLADG